MLNRRQWLLIVLIGAGCGRAQKPEVNLPRQLEGGWRLVRAQAFPADTAPAKIRNFGVTGVVRAAYQANQTMTVSLYEMKAPASALELVQTWKTDSNKVPFFEGKYFGLAESPDTERQTIQSFIAALQKALKQQARS